MFAYTQNNPVMGVDPDGEVVITILLTILCISAITLAFISLTDEDQNTLDNISFHRDGTGAFNGLSYVILGFGFSFVVDSPGETIDANGNTINTHTTNIQFGPLGFQRTTGSDGSDQRSLSLFFFFISYDINDIDNFDSWGAGVSLGISVATPQGNANVSIDIDYLQLIRDIHESQNNKYD